MVGTLKTFLAAAAAALACASQMAWAAEPLRLQAFGDPAELAAYRELIAAFQKANAGTEVEFIPVGKQRDHMAKLTTGFSGGSPPDLFLINFRRYGQFAAKGVLEPLGPALSARGSYKDSDFYEQSLEAFRFNGQLMCTPQNVSSLVVYYNVTMFKQLGLPTPLPTGPGPTSPKPPRP